MARYRVSGKENSGVWCEIDGRRATIWFKLTHAWWIRQTVGRAVADQGQTIRIPVHVGDKISYLILTTRRLIQELQLGSAAVG